MISDKRRRNICGIFVILILVLPQFLILITMLLRGNLLLFLIISLGILVITAGLLYFYKKRREDTEDHPEKANDKNIQRDMREF
jgi:ABC-type bacteriocin/lantibiotic exporter with double-glycine peptidase domain